MKTLIVSAVFVAALCTPALAQSEATPPNEACQVKPNDTASSQAPATADKRSLTATLEDCNGVLIPPKVGDSEMMEPAPAVGETPIIHPDELPKQNDPI